MANYKELKAVVQQVIKTNGNQDITGQSLQNMLVNMISGLGAEATFAGIATPGTNPGNPDGNVFYLALQPGLYTNFGNKTVKAGCIAVLANTDSGWSIEQGQPYFNQANLNIFTQGQYDISSAVPLAATYVPEYCQKAGFTLFFNDEAGQLRQYVFQGGTFSDAARWKEQAQGGTSSGGDGGFGNYVPKVTGKNMFDKDSPEIRHGYYGVDGAFTENAYYFTTPRIPISDGETLTCNMAVSTTSPADARQLIFNSVGEIIGQYASTKTITGTKGSAYCIFSCLLGTQGKMEDCQVEVGSESTEVEPYEAYSSLPPMPDSTSVEALNSEGGYDGQVLAVESGDVKWKDLVISMIRATGGENGQVATIRQGAVVWAAPSGGGGDGIPVYGVKMDLSDTSSTALERTGDAVGLTAYVESTAGQSGSDDFTASVYPYNKMRECNIEVTGNGAPKITYSGEDGFSRSKDTFIEIPLFYMNRYVKDGYEHREICEFQKGGFFPAPMFVEGGRILDRVYVAKYESSLDTDGAICSKTKSQPCVGNTLAELRELCAAKGKGFAEMDVRTLMSLQHLYLVRFADRNSQKLIGSGYTGLMQPKGDNAKVDPSNYGTSSSLKVVSDTLMDWFPDFVVKSVTLGFFTGGTLVDRASVLTVLYAGDGKNVTVNLGKDVHFTNNMTWGGCPQLTGAADSLVTDTGKTRNLAGDGTGAVLLFGMENLWGNAACLIDGVHFTGTTCAVGFDQTAYNDTGSGYTPVAEEMEESNTLAAYIGNLWTDNAHPWLAYPQSTANPGDADDGYGDGYTYSSGADAEAHGGAFYSEGRAGMFCQDCGLVGSEMYAYGSRMQFKILQ